MSEISRSAARAILFEHFEHLVGNTERAETNISTIIDAAIAEAVAEKDAEIMRLTAALIAISVLSSADLDYAEKVNAASAIASDTLHTPRPAEKEKKGGE